MLRARPRLIFPVGALEQHGPHLPFGTNIIIVQSIADEVARRTGLLHAPVFSYGVTVGGGPFEGRSGLRRKTFHRAVNELLGRWDDDGVEEFVIITAHRFEPHLEALLLTPAVSATNTVYDLYQIDVSDITESDPEFEHAGELETSLMLHLRPELVRMTEAHDFRPQGGALRKYTRRRTPTPPLESRGVLGCPSLATAKKGERIFERWVEAISAAVAGGASAGSDSTNREAPHVYDRS